MNNKLNELYEYSDPEEVNRKAMLLHLNEIHPSSRAKFKYMVFNGHRMVHFGQMGYDDYTKQKNKKIKEGIDLYIKILTDFFKQ